MVTREELYELVWSTPMIRVAEKFEVSGSYLARVCTELRVPRPERGYWAKLAVGKAPQRPALLEPLPGDPIIWSRADGLPAPAESRPRQAPAVRVPRAPRSVIGVHLFCRFGPRRQPTSSRLWPKGPQRLEQTPCPLAWPVDAHKWRWVAATSPSSLEVLSSLVLHLGHGLFKQGLSTHLLDLVRFDIDAAIKSGDQTLFDQSFERGRNLGGVPEVIDVRAQQNAIPPRAE
jgi:hypothetical protein